MTFKAISSKKKSVQVAEQILAAIRNGTYKVGDKLPPERVIEQEMGVSKTAVREALSALHLAGIVERIPGSGTYVRRPVDNPEALVLLEDSDSVEDAIDARRVVEKGIIELAIDRASEEEISKLEEILEEMFRLLGGRDYEEFFTLNEQFHLAIATATGNPLIVRVMQTLLRVTQQRLWKQTITDYFLKDERLFHQALEEHRQIFLALRDRDKSRAQQVMEQHFITMDRILKES